MLALLALAGASLLAAPLSHAADPYEPNDSSASAAGPLLLGGSYAASLERENDRDYFFFYMTSPAESPAELTVTNLGDGDLTAELDVTVFNSTETSLVSQSYIAVNRSGTLSTSLAAGKYFVAIGGRIGAGTTNYGLSVTGGPGAFAPYAEIAARCANATKSKATAATALHRAEAKLQRTTARLRRSRYGTSNARQSARRANRKARTRLKSAKRKVEAVTERQGLWCSTPQ